MWSCEERKEYDGKESKERNALSELLNKIKRGRKMISLPDRVIEPTVSRLPVECSNH